MEIGLCLPQLGGHVSRDGLRAFCERAEELGYGGLWVQEHIFYPLHPVSGYSARPGLKVPDAYRSTLGALETLTAAAAWTSRLVVGTSILVAGLHRPVALAQQLSTIDVLSQGRLVAGFSVGWSDEEHQVMDVDPRTRGARCDELIDALVACWGPDPVEFSGRFFTIPESEIRPKPVQQPRPRLLSGMRSPAGLRRTAEKFDIWNPASGPLEQHLEMFARIKEMRPAGPQAPRAVPPAVHHATCRGREPAGAQRGRALRGRRAVPRGRRRRGDHRHELRPGAGHAAALGAGAADARPATRGSGLNPLIPLT